MATTTTLLLPLLLLLLAASSSASARPCKTIFFFSSTSTSSSSSFTPLPQNPNPNPNSHYVTFYLTSTSNFRNSDPNPNRFFLIPKPFSTRLTFDRIGEEQGRSHRFRPEGVVKTNSFSDLKSRVYSTVNSSMKDRTKDIMSVVGALLFGMGCGALTAATMYLVWSLFMPNRFEFEDSDEEEFDGGDKFDDLYNPKKMSQGGYVAIPSKVVDDQEVKKAVDVDVAKQGE